MDQKKTVRPMVETRKMFFAHYLSGPGTPRFNASWVEIDRDGFVNPTDTDSGTPVEDLGEGILFKREVPAHEAQALVDEMLDERTRGFVRRNYSELFC